MVFSFTHKEVAVLNNVLKSFKFCFRGRPVAFVEPTFSHEKRKMEADRHYSAYIQHYRGFVEAEYAKSGAPEPFDGTIALKLTTFHKLRQDADRLKKRMAQVDELRPWTSPDLLNLERALYDASEGIVFKDKSQIVHVDKDKRYALHDDDLRIEAVFYKWPGRPG